MDCPFAADQGCAGDLYRFAWFFGSGKDVTSTKHCRAACGNLPVIPVGSEPGGCLKPTFGGLKHLATAPRGSNTPLLAEGYLIMKYKDIATGKILAHLQYMLDRMINEMYNLIVLQV